MATSGTYAFSMTRDSIINAALRGLEVVGDGVTAGANDLTNCAEALNIITKKLVMKGLPLYTIQDLSIPMVAAQATYNIGPVISAATSRPLRILQAYIRDNTTLSDVILQVYSRFDFDTVGLKSQQSKPNQLFYDPQFPNGIITVYNVPVDTSQTIHLIMQRQIQDFTAGTDNPDFPQEAYQMLKWCLMDEIGMEYGAKPHILAIAAKKAALYIEEFMDFEQEYASVYFTPTERSRNS